MPHQLGRRARPRRAPLGPLLVVAALTLPALCPGWLQRTARSRATFVVSSVNDGGPGSLRQAFIDANNNPGPDTITFHIGTGPQTIKPASMLPSLTDPVVIDGTTQPGYAGAPIIELDGSLLAEGSGLALAGGDSTVRGLVIHSFHFNGISIGFKGGNRVEGCYIGTDLSGTRALPNLSHGISIPSSNNTVGGTTPAARNVISGNGDSGIDVSRFCCSGNESAITGNVIQGNYVGVNAAGDAAIPNGREGVRISSVNSNVPVTNNLVGGTTPATRNVISGNGFDGLELDGFHVRNNTVQGNFIGTDATGAFAIPNAGTGLTINSGSDNLVGGSAPGARNVISGNGRDGSGVSGGHGVALGTGSGNVVRGNVIGANAALTAPLPNLLHGVAVGGTNSVVGGAAPGEGNVIAFNGLDGIAAGAASSAGNSFRGNSIHSNGQHNHPSNASIGIDLAGAGVTPNDPGDADAGANNLQNFPVITSVTAAAGSLNVKGTLDSTPGAAFDLDFYANSVCDPLGFGEGARRVGSARVTTGPGGGASFDLDFQVSLPAGQVITATATDPAGNTSEFSQCAPTAGAAGSVGFNSTSPTLFVGEGEGAATFVVSRTGGSAGQLTVGFATAPGGSAAAGSDYTQRSGTLTFAHGETSKTFTVPIIDDGLDEPRETFRVTLRTAGNLDVLGSLGVMNVEISDNDAPPGLSVGDVSAAEGTAGTTAFVFPVTLSAPSSRTVTVTFGTADGTATGGSDYSPPAAAPLSFAPGETSKAVTVFVSGDGDIEPDETFFANLSDPTNATIGDGQGVGTVKNDDAASSFQFNAAAFDAAEGAHTATVTVTRTGDTSAAGSVAYATADATATERKDYTAAVGRLRFAPGELQKSFQVIVTDDRFDDDGESFNVTLGGPAGGSLGAQGTAAVRVADDDAAHGPSPVKDATINAEFFVRQHYADFLNRVPDQDGLNHWTGQMTNCGAADLLVCRINVSAAFFLSIENQETGYLVHRAYKAAYGNLPGKPVPLTLGEYLAGSRRVGEGVQVGVGDWSQRLEANKRAFFDEFVGTARFAAAYPANMTAASFVGALNQNAGGALSPAERDQLAAGLASGAKTRAQVLRAAAEDADFAQGPERARAFVLAQYFGYLRRDPDGTDFRGEPDPNFDGYLFWLGKLNQFNGNFIRAEMVRAFIQSIEYGERFGQ